MEIVGDKLLEVTKHLEKQVDATIEAIDNLDVNDLDQLRKSRIQELKKNEEKRKNWLLNGHGEYEELAEEKMFFDVIKKSENVVVHFYTNTNERCKIVDKHLKILAPKHVEAKFCKLNAEKCPFLANNLKIKTIPSIVLVHGNIMVDKIVGFTQLGNRDDFTTETLEWRIAQQDIIKYDGDLSTPPYLREKKGVSNSNKKIRDGSYKKDDDDIDFEEYTLTKEEYDASKKISSEHLSAELTAEEAAELGLD
ncbi:hypothetical protein WA026_000187 [Henosepilachna vigintioctopunctata]|uniref:Thioredoxin domain-containing protein 9 n=1 Tax=Henosepilachna vigintioctopunctata TaxID=420089 RepID=A0AAW1V502_9CUCU